MNKIELGNFKCFAQSFEFSLDSNNILLYGENGSGKSSLTAAFQLIFYSNKLFEALIFEGMPEQEQENIKSDILDKYRYQGERSQPFSLKIDGVDYNDFPIDSYQVSILTHDDVEVVDSIHLYDILKRAYLPIPDISKFLTDYAEQMEQEVNQLLHEYFMEDLQISIERGNDYTCTLLDNSLHLTFDKNLPNYFNEAKLHMTTILLLFLAVKHLSDATKEQLLILDDLLTSMDASNRTFFMRYIVETFSDYQILFFTHNINFYHTARYLVHEAIPTGNKNWTCTHLYKFSFGHSLLNKDEAQKDPSEFKRELNSPGVNLEDMGNRLRKRFEYAIYEISQLLQLGAVEEPDKVLARICSEKECYLYENKDAADLVGEIRITLDSENQTNLAKRIRDKIETYSIDMTFIHEILNVMKLYQKASLHPLSHTNTNGTHTPSQKELKQTIILLKKLQVAITKLKDKRIE